MPVREADVAHIASLARLGLDASRIPAIVRELNGILAHMDVLSRVDTSPVHAMVDASDVPAGLRLRDDDQPPLELRRAREAFAPEMRDGFFLVPRLATHEDAGDPEAAG